MTVDIIALRNFKLQVKALLPCPVVTPIGAHNSVIVCQENT